MPDADTPVRWLTVIDPRLQGEVTVEIPADLPPAVEAELTALDQNHDGTLTYTPFRNQPGDSYQTEVHHFDSTVDRLYRFLWRFQGAAPDNSRAINTDDRSNYPRRMEAIARMQVPLRQAAEAVLGTEEQRRGDRDRWTGAKRILSLTADYEGLFILAHEARRMFDSEPPHDVQYLLVAEKFLLAAQNFASSVREGRENFLAEIARELETMRPDLERATSEREAAGLLRSPHLFLGRGTPLTMSVETMETGGEITLEVSVPRSFVEEQEGLVEVAIRDWFMYRDQVFLERGVFRDAIDRRRFQLLPSGRIERDLPGSEDDRTGGDSSFHLEQPHLDRTLFRDHEMAYYRVGFRLPPGAAREALGGESIRSMNAVLVRNGQMVRRVEGAILLQHRRRLQSEEAVTGDIHVSAQDLEVLHRTVLELERQVENGRRPDFERIVPEVERYLGSINQRVRLAVELWRERFRNREISRVFILGDVSDFVNIALRFVVLGYRSTNLRQVIETLADAEVPILIGPGNHDRYATRYQYGDRAPYFYGMDFFRKLLRYFDRHANPGDANPVERAGAILTRSCSSTLDCLWEVFREVTAPDPDSLRHDDHQGPQLAAIGPYENYCNDLGTGHTFCILDSRWEDYNYFHFLDNRNPPPHLPNMERASQSYVGDHKINAVGFSGDIFVGLLRKLETAEGEEAEGGPERRLILGLHHNAVSSGRGPDGTAGTENVLRGDVAIALRAAGWFYRTGSGRSRIAVVIGAHTHGWEEYDLQGFPTDPLCREELGSIFEGKNPAIIYSQIFEWARRWRINERVRIRATSEPGSDGFPGPIVREFNADSDRFSRERGPLYVSTPTAGMGLETGEVRLTTQWDMPNNRPGRITVAPHYFRERPDGTVVESDGPHLPNFLQEELDEAIRWGPTIMQPIAPYVRPAAPTVVQILRGEPTDGDGIDFPAVYCGAGHYCLRVDLSPFMGLDTRLDFGAGLMLGASVVAIPERRGTVRQEFGGPYNFEVGFDYLLNLAGRDQWRFRAGGDFGWLDIYPTVQTDFRRELAFGLQMEVVPRSHLLANPLGSGGIYGNLLPIPGIRGWAQVGTDGIFSGGIALVINPTAVAFERSPETP